MNKEQLLTRLDELGDSLAHTDHALALIGLGSVGNELLRLDQFSDLDFFAIVETDKKNEYLNNLRWIERVAPVDWHFQNTVDGRKLLFSDGVFCEFAVFEPHELPGIAYSAGRIVWKREDQLQQFGVPELAEPIPEHHNIEWLLGEALTNLYVGLCRYYRGEKISAFRFVQGYAVDKVLDLIERTSDGISNSRDPFSRERRFEQRFPDHAPLVLSMLEGAKNTPKAALALLDFLEEHWSVAPSMATRIRELVTEH